MILQGSLQRISGLGKKSKLLVDLYLILKSLYSGLRQAVYLARNFCNTAKLYGFWKNLRLYRMDHASWKRCSLINRRIDLLVSQMARHRYVEGSATQCRWLYHDYALPEIRLKAHRKNTTGRLLFLRKHLPVYKARILDIGCSSGGIALGLALLGASKVTGIDHDEVAVQIAIAVADKYEIDNAEFYASSLSDFAIPEVDIIVWLSQWMWVVKQHGLEYGKDLLFEIPKLSGASMMVFESAANDGKAAIPSITQSDIESFLHSLSPFTVIKNMGPFKDRWRPLGQERMVFICSEPRFTWQGKEATIKRVNRHTIVKEYKPQRLWAKDLEVQCLHRLEPFPHFPNLIDVGENWIKMEWAGNRINDFSSLEQLDEIIRILSSVGIVHRDICPENLLYRDGQLFLIDFGWAIVDGQKPPVTPGEGIGRGFYVYGEWDDTRAAKKVRDWFEKRS